MESLEKRQLLSAAANLSDSSAQPAAHAVVQTKMLSGYMPAEVSATYGLGTSSTDGAGQTIALVEAYSSDTLLSDVGVFDQQFKLPAPPSLSQVNENGGPTLPAPDAVWARETSLDVEWAHAMAPEANIVVVEARSDSLSDLLRAVDTARHLRDVSVVSVSWGVNEFAGETALDFLFTTPGGHQPITFVASSGDRAKGSTLQWPGTSPDVISVGGSSLNGAGDNGALETSWSGGVAGTSQYESSAAPSSSAASARVVPDVVYSADPSHGFAVFDGPAGGWQMMGGTSAGAPQWAALIADANAIRASEHLSTLSTAQALNTIRAYYANPATGTPGSPGKLTTPGGAPQAANVVDALVHAANVPDTPTPAGAGNPGASPHVHARPFALQAILPARTAAIVPSVSRNAAGLRAALSGNIAQTSAVSSTTSVTALIADASVNSSDLWLATASAADALFAGAGGYSSLFHGEPTLFSMAQAIAGGSGVIAPVGLDSALETFSAARYTIAHLDVTSAFCDAIAAFIDDSAASVRHANLLAVEPSGPHFRAWTITGAVILIDVMVLTHLRLRQRRANATIAAAV